LAAGFVAHVLAYVVYASLCAPAHRPKILAQPDKEKGPESIRAFGLFGRRA
jgi:hypothetical protein